MTLTDFLLARIAEDEELSGWPEGVSALHDRVLAECEAKRRIVVRASVECSCTDHGFDRIDGCSQCVACHAVTLCDGYVLVDLASIYADHPDYRDEWKP